MEGLDFREIQQEFNRLLMETENKIDKEWTNKYVESDVNGGKFTILSLYKISIVNYSGVIGLTNLSEEQGLNIYLATPSLNRAIIDNFFTLIYLLDDFPNNNKLFIKNSLREKKEILDFEQNHYSDCPEWKDDLSDKKLKYDYYKRFVDNNIGLTEIEEKDNFKNMQRFLRVHKIVEYLEKKNHPNMYFFNYLKHHYIKLSHLAHSQPAGLIEIGNILDRNKKNLNWSFINEQRWLSIALVLSFISEIEHHFDYRLTEQLNKIWQFMGNYKGVVLEVYELRYKNLIAK